MIEISNKTRFPDIERQEEPRRGELLAQARGAVTDLKRLVAGHEELLERQRLFEEQQRQRENDARRVASYTLELVGLKERFLTLQGQDERRQSRGYELERLLTDLLDLNDLEPHIAYRTDIEQIDGSFRLDTDDYIIEAKWKEAPVGREQADVFAAKVHSKGRNALGLFVSVGGFTKDFLKRFEVGTPFVTMDGDDMFMVLDARIRLDDALRAKRRHANDTGSCHYPIRAVLT